MTRRFAVPMNPPAGRRARAAAVLAGALLLVACAAPATDPVARAPAAPVAAPPAPARPEAPLEVVSAQFGVFGADPSGRRTLYETDKFPAVVAAPYGWTVIFKTARPTVIWREEFELPAVPPTWGPGEALGIFTVSPDRRTAVTERIVPTRVGFIGNEWRYAPGDPLGAHKMRVYIDGVLVKEFAFEIEKGPVDLPQRRNPHSPGTGPGTRT